MKRLDHPNILKLSGYSETNSSIYLYLEYCNQGYLLKYLELFSRKFKKREDSIMKRPYPSWSSWLVDACICMKRISATGTSNLRTFFSIMVEIILFRSRKNKWFWICCFFGWFWQYNFSNVCGDWWIYRPINSFQKDT